MVQQIMYQFSKQQYRPTQLFWPLVCRQLSLLIASLLALGLMASCQPTELAATAPVTLTIAGATAMRPVLIELTNEFSQQHPHVFFDIIGGDSTTGETRVRMGEIDLAASTLISPTVTTTLGQSDAQPPMMRIPIGLDGIVMIAHQTNPINSLTLIQLQGLYSGRIWNWQELGGDDATVLLIVREDGSGSRKLFDDRVMGETAVALTAVVLPTSKDVVDYVAGNPTAIGYVSRAYVIDQLNELALDTPKQPSSVTLPPIHLVALEDQLPNNAALQSQSYFLIQPIYLVSNGQPRGWVKQFIDFTLSPAGQAIVAHYHLPIR